MTLPNLTSLRAFEAAARYLSFTRAAVELNVLPPAVSRQIADLETSLGASLFLRTKPKLTLTPEGQAFFASVSSGFSEIERGADAIRGRAERQVLTVNVSIGIASCWLMARLGDFRARHPEIELQLITRDSNYDFIPEEADVLVLFSERGLPGMRSHLIFSEELLAVCAPQYEIDLGTVVPGHLRNERLLRLRSPEYAKDWETWFEYANLEAPPANPALTHNSFIVYLQAALNGEGVALSWRTLTDDLIDSGRLCQVTNHSVRTDRGYYCCLPPRADNDPRALAFVDWVTGDTFN